ncbi:MAG: histidinol dehydrogenase [Bdellovibrionales bacterium]|nr:histidinol dehydrogenase [Bdellovibrionales bacterium]
MKIYSWSKLDRNERESLFLRPSDKLFDKEVVRKILLDVREQGAEAILRYTEDFDKVRMTDLFVEKDEISSAFDAIDSSLKLAFLQAAGNIETFHRAQLEFAKDIKVIVEPGVVCEQVSRPISRVGIYVPGGTAPLFSTVLMLAIPARIAGCTEIVVATPPQRDGKINPAILAACQLSGVTEIIKVGGAQAIAALAFGADKLFPVKKIFGPGNAWVTEAKRQVTQMCPSVGCDLPAGPSEVLVLADETADANFVVWDLLSQAEHGPDSQVLLVSTSEDKIREVLSLLEQIVPDLERADLVRSSLASSRAIFCENLDAAIDCSNQYGPEHLIINARNPRDILEKVTAAGSVFLGPWSPESVGDYASGTNHVLPTSGAAHYTGGVSLSSFLRRITVQELTSEGLLNLSATVETMAAHESLTCHAQAVRVRRKVLENSLDDNYEKGRRSK